MGWLGLPPSDGRLLLLLNLGALTTVGNCAPKNLISIIFDNAAYASTGGLPTRSNPA